MSFLNVLGDMFAALFANPGSLFSIFAVLGVALGFGIYQLGCYLGWW